MGKLRAGGQSLIHKKRVGMGQIIVWVETTKKKGVYV